MLHTILSRRRSIRKSQSEPYPTRTITLLIRRRTNVQIPSLEIDPVEFFEALFTVFRGPHGHKPKSTGPSVFASDQADIANGSYGLEELKDILFVALEGNIPDVHLEIPAVFRVSSLLDILLDAFQIAFR